jgi:microcystin-dependent protein
MNHNDASRVIDVIDGRISRNTQSGAGVEYTFGTIFLNSGSYASAYLYGETDPTKASAYFALPNGLYPAAGDAVRVGMDKARGTRFIDQVFPKTPYPKIAWDLTGGRILVGDGSSAPTSPGALSAFILTLLDDVDAAHALATLGAQAYGSYQTLDAELTALAGLVSAADRMPYFTGSGSAALATFTSAARSLLDDGDAATMRGTLGLGSAATHDATELNPTGIINLWPAAAPPTGWLICNGASLLRADYAALFSVIGTTYGSVDGTHFSLPDMRGNVPMGVSASHALASTGGAETHTLTSAEMPSHTHTQDAHAHNQKGYGATLGSGSVGWRIGSSGTQTTDTGITSTTATNQNTGGGGAHNNLQPYLALNYIIKS